MRGPAPRGRTRIVVSSPAALGAHGESSVHAEAVFVIGRFRCYSGQLNSAIAPNSVYAVLSIPVHVRSRARGCGARAAPTGQTSTFISAERDIVLARRTDLLGDPSQGELEVRHELATGRRHACGRQAACRKIARRRP